MGYTGKETEDMIIQKAYGQLKKRGYTLPLDSCYYALLGELQRNGKEALEEYVNKVEFKKNKSKVINFYVGY